MSEENKSSFAPNKEASPQSGKPFDENRRLGPSKAPSGPANPRWWLKYLIAFLSGLLAVFLMALMRGIFADTYMDLVLQKELPMTSMQQVRILSDAFFIVGMLMTLFAAILFVSMEGAFDGIAYAVKSLTWAFRIRDPYGYKHQSFADYKAAKAAKARPPLLYMLIIGLLFVGVAAILAFGVFKP